MGPANARSNVMPVILPAEDMQEIAKQAKLASLCEWVTSAP